MAQKGREKQLTQEKAVNDLLDTLKVNETVNDFGGMKRINKNPDSHEYFLECKRENILRQTQHNNRPMKVVRIENESIVFNDAGTEFNYTADVIVQYGR